MDTLGCIQAWLILQEQQQQSEVPEIQISSIPGLLILILILTPLIDLHPVFAAQLLARGSRGQDVAELQNDLKQAGCMPRSVRSTGYYGKITKAAVQKLQRTHGLRVDGVVGEQTRNALGSGKTCQSLASSGVLKMGSRGEKVRELQSQLNNVGFQVKEDGIFGKETRAAVIQFQESQRLKSDGIVEPKTTKVLGTPQTQVSQSAVSAEGLEALSIGNQSEDLQDFLDEVSFEDLEEVYSIPTLEKFNKLQTTLLEKSKQKEPYLAAAQLVLLWRGQQGYKNWDNSLSSKNKNINSIVVINSTNSSSPKRLQEETLPVNSLLSVLDKGIDESIKDKNPQQQFILAYLRTLLGQKSTETVIDVFTENLKVSNLDIYFQEEAGGLVPSISDISAQSLSTIFNADPDALNKYWSKKNVNYDELLINSNNNKSIIQLLINLASIDDKEALNKIINIIKSSEEYERFQIAEYIANSNLIKRDEELKSEAINILKKYIEDQENEVYRISATSALAKIEIETDQDLKDKDMINLLKEDLKDKDESTRVLAALELLRLGIHENKESQIDIITAISDSLASNSDTVDASKKAVLQTYQYFFNDTPLCVLASIGEPAIQPLKKVSQTSKNPQLRKNIEMIILYLKNPSVNYPFFVKVCALSDGGGQTIPPLEGTNDGIKKIARTITQPPPPPPKKKGNG